MNRGRIKGVHSAGYTVVETLVFLAVSAAMFVSAAVLINGRQGKVEFNNAVRDFESQIIDIANDVATGYYDGNTNLTCSISGSGPTAQPQISSGSATRGERKDCIFVGRTLALHAAPSANQYNVYTMVGLRLIEGSSAPVSQLTQTHPKVFDTNGLSKTVRIGANATACIKVGAAACNTTTAISFVSRLNGNLIESSSTGGAAVAADLYVSNFLSLTASSINDGFLPTPVNNNTVNICLTSGSSNQHAIITLTGATSVSIKSEIGEGPSPSSQCS